VIDWATVSSLATAGGTLVLAVAAFASVRSANRAARAAELSLLDGLRPVLVPSRLQDPPEKISFVDQHWVHVDGGNGLLETAGDAVYLAIALLYGDQEGGQRAISRFSLLPFVSGEERKWLAVVSRHWNLDRADPR
jgi:hypothetical protein